MQKKPAKKFLPSDAPKSNFRKSSGPGFGSRSGGGKYPSKSFRPDNTRDSDFEELLPKKKTRGVGGSDNQRPRGDNQKPLYSTAKKRYEGPPIFREKKEDFEPRSPRGNDDEGGRREGFSRENQSKNRDWQKPKPASRSGSQGGFTRDEPKPFIKKKEFGGGSKPERENQYRGDGEFPKKPFRSEKKEGFSGGGERKPFIKKKDFGGEGEFPKTSFRSYRSNKGGDEPRPFIRKKEFNPEFPRSKGDDDRGPSRGRPVRKSGTAGRGPAKPYREKSEFSSKFSGKKSFDKNRAHGKKSKKEESVDLTVPFRLNKYLAHAGIAARREADELIKDGLVTVNGTVVLEMGHKVQPGDEVRFKGRIISPEKKVYIMLNKPKDYITTANDERGRPTVMELVQDATDLRIYPVGRLDRNTTGLLILTNDGELAQKLTHPSFEAKKVYLVTLDKTLKGEAMEHIADGVELEEGKALVDAVEYADPRDKRKIGIEIHIGWNKVVRRIFETLGYEVVQLDRVYYAGLTKDVPRGKWRNLTEKEVIMLKHFTK